MRPFKHEPFHIGLWVGGQAMQMRLLHDLIVVACDPKCLRKHVHGLSFALARPTQKWYAVQAQQMLRTDCAALPWGPLQRWRLPEVPPAAAPPARTCADP